MVGCPWGEVTLLFHLSQFLCADEPLRRKLLEGGGGGNKSDLDPHKLACRLAPMRSDSTSSVDSRSSLSGRGEMGVAGERKHSRKPQQVFSSKRREEEGRGRADSLSISVDWGALPSNMSLNNSSLSATPLATPLNVSSGSNAGPSSEPMDTLEAVGCVVREEPSTIVSLPLVFSAVRAESSDSAESASSSNPVPHQLVDGGSQRPVVGTALSLSKESLVSHAQKPKPLSAEVVKPVVSVNGDDTPLKRERGGADGSGEDAPRGIVLRGVFDL